MFDYEAVELGNIASQEFLDTYFQDPEEFEKQIVETIRFFRQEMDEIANIQNEDDKKDATEAMAEYLNSMMSVAVSPQKHEETVLYELNKLYDKLQEEPEFIKNMDRLSVLKIFMSLQSNKIRQEMHKFKRYVVQGEILDLLTDDNLLCLVSVVEAFLCGLKYKEQILKSEDIKNLYINICKRTGHYEITKEIEGDYSFFSYAKALLPKEFYEKLYNHPESKFNPIESKEGDYVDKTESKLRRLFYVIGVLEKTMYVDCVFMMGAGEFYEWKSEFINNLIIGLNLSLQLTSPENVKNQISKYAKELGVPNQ